MPAHAVSPEPDAESHRRLLLAHSDRILDRVERLRLAGRHDAPPELADAVLALRARIGRVAPGARPQTAAALSNLLFAMQQRLMASNPRRPLPRVMAGRPAGTPVVTPIRPGIEWKLLVLPARVADSDAEWLELIDATIDRALERWAYAQRHAVLAARAHRATAAPLAVARVAWNNYWELLEEAESIRRSLDAAPRPARLSA